ncbi:MAG: type I restriction enzyme HsdR N-terminal domain-containing protein [Bacteroidetes bacterium]|nr:type I restriction enzyme HsdR N-terminal domain-containing protein [Bacteroidota bacterium]
MQPLNLPNYSFKIKSAGQRKLIFDEIRKKWIALTPEEWVRQNVVRYLSDEKGWPVSLMAVETEIKVNRLSKRCDIVLHDNHGVPVMIVECKAPAVKITQEVFEQIARYNMALKVQYLLVTNGVRHFCCRMDYVWSRYEFVEEIPEYS